MAWHRYHRTDGEDHEIAWQTNMYGRSPDRTRPLRFDVRFARGSDLSEADEEELAHAFEADLLKGLDARFVGQVRTASDATLSFYSPRHKGFIIKKDARKVFAALAKDIAAEFDGLTLTTETVEDEEWELFESLLPSSNMIQWFADAKHVAELVASEGGPDPDATAVILHGLFFDTEATRDATAGALKEAGHSAQSRVAAPDEDTDHPFGLVVRCEVARVNVMDIHPDSLLLARAALDAEGSYEGWRLATPDERQAPASGDAAPADTVAAAS